MGYKEGDWGGWPAFASLESGNEVSIATDTEGNDRFEHDLLVISFEELKRADFWGWEVREDGAEESVNSLDPSYCVCGESIVGDIYSCYALPTVSIGLWCCYAQRKEGPI